MQHAPTTQAIFKANSNLLEVSSWRHKLTVAGVILAQKRYGWRHACCCLKPNMFIDVCSNHNASCQSKVFDIAKF